MAASLSLSVAVDRFPIAGSFTISRGSRTEAVVVTATVALGDVVGRGECVPYPRYGETVEGVAALIGDQAGWLAHIDAANGAAAAEAARLALQSRLPAGAARNALDCALWDLQAKASGRPVWQLAGLAEPRPVVTAYTLSLGSPESMEQAARAAADRPLLKVKLGGAGDAARIAAVRAGAPKAVLIVDANEAWTEAVLDANLAACRAAGVTLIEQPFPAGHDTALVGVSSDLNAGITICADESVHDRETLPGLAGRYQAINIKLDKTGGLTEALAMARAAQASGLAIMVGCMVGTSLAMAPATMLTSMAAFVDLDGPLLLARDRDPGLRFDGSLVHPPQPALWG